MFHGRAVADEELPDRGQELNCSLQVHRFGIGHNINNGYR